MSAPDAPSRRSIVALGMAGALGLAAAGRSSATPAPAPAPAPAKLPATPRDDTFYSHQFGFVGDGSSSNDAAAEALGEAVGKHMMRRGHGPTDSQQISGVDIRFAPGDFLLTAASPILSRMPQGRSRGLSISGAGFADQTRIIYRPAARNQALFRNEDSWSALRIANFAIDGDDPTAVVFDQISHKNVSGNLFEDIRISGRWAAGWRFSGSNLGSEQSFHRCTAIKGDFEEAMVLIGKDANDQFVNYWFHDCGLAPLGGHGIAAWKGGSINVIGGSHSALNARKRQGYMFYFPLGDHARGAQRLYVAGLRVEYKKSGKFGLLYSRWKAGTILFDSIHDDISWYRGGEQPDGLVTVDAGFSNAAGPAIVFRGCSLSGRHRYIASGKAAAQAPVSLRYESCRITEYARAEDFLDAGVAGDAPQGAVPVVSFAGCVAAGPTPAGFAKGAFGQDRALDQQVNWQVSVTAPPVLRSLRFAMASGAGPFAAKTLPAISLPPNAQLVRLTLGKPEGGTGGGSQWQIHLRDGSGAEIATLAARGLEWRAGWGRSLDLFHTADTEAKRHLTLHLEGTDPPSAEAGQAIVEFYA